MNIFDRYLLRTIFITTLIALTFLLGIDLLIQTASEIEDIGRGHYTVSLMFATLALSLPQKIILFMPAAVLLGAIMGLGQLAGQNELAVARVSGHSPLYITRSGLLFALALGCLAIVLGETIAPAWQAKSDLLRNQALGQSSDLTQRQGFWLRDGQHIVHIGGVNRDGSIAQLRLLARDDSAFTLITAEQAKYDGKLWQLHQSKQIQISNTGVRILTNPKHWHNPASPQTLQTLAQANDNATIAELITLTKFLKANGLDNRRQSLDLWQRLLQPLSTATMLLLALPFVFGQIRSAQQGTRLVIGILLGVSYYVLVGILTNTALIFGWPPWLGALAPITILACLPLFWLFNT